jgi:hypothetical protein
MTKNCLIKDLKKQQKHKTVNHPVSTTGATTFSVTTLSITTLSEVTLGITINKTLHSA